MKYFFAIFAITQLLFTTSACPLEAAFSSLQNDINAVAGIVGMVASLGCVGTAHFEGLGPLIARHSGLVQGSPHATDAATQIITMATLLNGYGYCASDMTAYTSSEVLNAITNALAEIARYANPSIQSSHNPAPVPNPTRQATIEELEAFMIAKNQLDSNMEVIADPTAVASVVQGNSGIGDLLGELMAILKSFEFNPEHKAYVEGVGADFHTQYATISMMLSQNMNLSAEQVFGLFLRGIKRGFYNAFSNMQMKASHFQ